MHTEERQIILRRRDRRAERTQELERTHRKLVPRWWRNLRRVEWFETARRRRRLRTDHILDGDWQRCMKACLDPRWHTAFMS